MYKRLSVPVRLPVGATDTENSIIDVEKCTGCGVCARACPSGAITMMPVELPPQQKKDDACGAAGGNPAQRKGTTGVRLLSRSWKRREMTDFTGCVRRLPDPAGSSQRYQPRGGGICSRRVGIPTGSWRSGARIRRGTISRQKQWKAAGADPISLLKRKINPFWECAIINTFQEGFLCAGFYCWKMTAG